MWLRPQPDVMSLRKLGRGGGTMEVQWIWQLIRLYTDRRTRKQMLKFVVRDRGLTNVRAASIQNGLKRQGQDEFTSRMWMREDEGQA